MDIVRQLTEELSLWKPQRAGLNWLSKIIRSLPDLSILTKEISTKLSEEIFSRPIFFDTKFPSFCYAIATGCGKTRLMGACIAYLYHEKGFRNFFILAPGETIYKKLINNFTPHHPKYVLRGHSDLPSFTLVTGDNYDRTAIANQLLFNNLLIYVFNIQKIFNPREDVTFKFHQFRETLGSSFADILRAKKDLVILMDESHRYRGPASLSAMNDLEPVLGLEFTATPAFKGNVIYEYSLGQALREPEPLVKTPVVLGRRGQDVYKDELEDIKLKDGIERHRRKKALLNAYCFNTNQPLVLPLVLISTANIAHADAIKKKIESYSFFNGDYIGKVIRTHSKTGADDADIERLINLENPDNDVEIVIHVNKLKEGWDVKNVYTIIPLRASVSEILTEQTIGRGLRLPFGRRTGDGELDTLEIMAHEHYADIVRQAKQYEEQYGSPIITKAIEDQPEEETEPYEVKPLKRPKYKIKIPLIRLYYRTKAEIKEFPIKPSQEFAAIDVERVKTKLGEGMEEEEKIGVVSLTEGEDPITYLSRLLLEDAPMLSSSDSNDRKVIPKLVCAYLSRINKDQSKWSKIVVAHTQSIFNDIVNQIEENLRVSSVKECEIKKGYVEFRSWKKAKPKDYVCKAKDRIKDEECVGEVVGEYERTIFEENVFDSKQEKWLADIMDRDLTVKRWMRLPKGQAPIFYGVGEYNPDFVAETQKACYVVEVKARDEIGAKDVLEKAKAAIDWCKEAQKVTRKKWQYDLIPHDAIRKGDRFNQIVSRRVRLEQE